MLHVVFFFKRILNKMDCTGPVCVPANKSLSSTVAPSQCGPGNVVNGLETCLLNSNIKGALPFNRGEICIYDPRYNKCNNNTPIYQYECCMFPSNIPTGFPDFCEDIAPNNPGLITKLQTFLRYRNTNEPISRFDAQWLARSNCYDGTPRQQTYLYQFTHNFCPSLNSNESYSGPFMDSFNLQQIPPTQDLLNCCTRANQSETSFGTTKCHPMLCWESPQCIEMLRYHCANVTDDLVCAKWRQHTSQPLTNVIPSSLAVSWQSEGAAPATVDQCLFATRESCNAFVNSDCNSYEILFPRLDTLHNHDPETARYYKTLSENTSTVQIFNPGPTYLRSLTATCTDVNFTVTFATQSLLPGESTTMTVSSLVGFGETLSSYTNSGIFHTRAFNVDYTGPCGVFPKKSVYFPSFCLDASGCDGFSLQNEGPAPDNEGWKAYFQQDLGVRQSPWDVAAPLPSCPAGFTETTYVTKYTNSNNSFSVNGVYKYYSSSVTTLDTYVSCTDTAFAAHCPSGSSTKRELCNALSQGGDNNGYGVQPKKVNSLFFQNFDPHWACADVYKHYFGTNSNNNPNCPGCPQDNAFYNTCQGRDVFGSFGYCPTTRGSGAVIDQGGQWDNRCSQNIDYWYSLTQSRTCQGKQQTIQGIYLFDSISWGPMTPRRADFPILAGFLTARVHDPKDISMNDDTNEIGIYPLTSFQLQ